jgi:DNA-binding FadR family transcriptional regulator
MHYRLIDDLGLAILRGEFQPGQSFPSEVRLCEKLGVSRTAMREAIRGIVAKGLVESRPKIGTRVRGREHWNHLDPDVLRGSGAKFKFRPDLAGK